MNRDETLREIQKRIALARGYRDLQEGVVAVGADWPAGSNWLTGVLHTDEGLTLVPRWPWDWCDAGVLVDEFGGVKGSAYALAHSYASRMPHEMVFSRARRVHCGSGETAQEAIARAWCSWKRIDLSDLP